MDKNLLQVLFQKAHVEALINNQKQVSKWDLYKKEILEVQDRLQLFLLNLNVPIMVPVGNKALFRGKMVHTNDITISLGDGYFTKGSVTQALDIISRRLQKCDEMLQRLETERGLFQSRANIQFNHDLYPHGNEQDIIEEFAVDEEEAWRINHRNKVKDYKQKLAKMKEKEPSEINNDEDLWKRLDILEMEEEINDEIDRLGSDSELSSDNTDSDTSDESSGETKHITSKFKNVDLKEVCLAPTNEQTSSSSRSSISTHETNDSDECIKINFKHSSHKPSEILGNGDVINSPCDIFLKYSHLNKKKRRVSFAVTPDVKIFENDNIPEFPDNKQIEESSIAFGDVVERTIPFEFKMNESRPASKFKLSRNNQRMQ